jgi:N-acetylglucosaminyldiphosphoundecaprenol N-acetyl-beta-D-mannosaminyltransferase
MTTSELEGIPRARVGSLEFSVIPLSAAIRLILRLGGGDLPSGVPVHFCNAYNVALADSDPAYRDLVNAGAMVFSDGTPVVWAGRRLHPPLASRWTRVYGPDVMEGVLSASDASGPRHYLLGSTPQTLAQLQSSIAARWPSALVVGGESPPFRAMTPNELAERDFRVRSSGATLVWVGLGTPKQDHEVARLAASLPVVALAVGAAFDFLAGTVSQAPPWMQRSGLEWSYRLAQEPGRLARRYLWGNPRFVAAVVRQRFRAH